MSTLKVGTIQDHANSNTAISINSSGVVSEPVKPAFRAKISAITLSNSTWTLMNANDTDYNNGSHYNTTSKKFIVPINGVYYFYARWFGPGSTGRGSSAIYVNGSIAIQNLTPMSNISGGIQHSVDSILNLQANDEVQWYAYQESGGDVAVNTGNSLTHWGGFLIG